MYAKKLLKRLKPDDVEERVGFVLNTGRVVELKNVCPEPKEGFEVSAADLQKYSDKVVASWHTHPGANANLTVEDARSFRDFPEWEHYIIGTDGVKRYLVKDGAVIVG